MPPFTFKRDLHATIKKKHELELDTNRVPMKKEGDDDCGEHEEREDASDEVMEDEVVEVDRVVDDDNARDEYDHNNTVQYDETVEHDDIDVFASRPVDDIDEDDCDDDDKNDTRPAGKTVNDKDVNVVSTEKATDGDYWPLKSGIVKWAKPDYRISDKVPDD